MQKVVTSVRGPLGREIRHEDLPRAGKLPQEREAQEKLVYAICGGLMSLSEAEELYGLTPSDFQRWLEEFEVPSFQQSIDRGVAATSRTLH